MIRQVIFASIIAAQCAPTAFGDDRHKLPKKPYDPTRKIGLDRAFEIGKPGKTKFTPTTPKNTTTRIHVSEHRESGTTKKYGTSKTYGGKKYGSKKTGGRGTAYDPIERATVVKYNNMVVEANKRLKTAGRIYGKTIKPLFFDEEANLDEVKEAQDYLTARVAKIHKVMKAYNVPNTKGADALNKAHLAFLNYQQEMTKGPLNEIMEFLEDPNLKPEDKTEEIKKIIEEMRKGEVKHYLALKRAQDAYGDAHGIEIIREKMVQPGKGKAGPPGLRGRGRVIKKVYRSQG